MSLPRYPNYKDSGVEWLGDVPGHWEVAPQRSRNLTHLCSLKLTHQVRKSLWFLWSLRPLSVSVVSRGCTAGR